MNLLKDLEDAGYDLETVKKFAQEELERRKYYEFLLSDPYLFHVRMLAPAGKAINLRQFHKEGLKFIGEGKKRKLILWPRGHLKSTIFTQGEAFRRALINPNIRILINSNRIELAQGFLKAIKGYCLDPRIRDAFGTLLPTNKSGPNFKNNANELTLLTRTDLTLKEATFTCSGLDQSKASQHYDLIIHEDIMSENNTETPDQLEKAFNQWRDTFPLLEPDGTMWVIGTRWHPLDVYGRIMLDYTDGRCCEAGWTHVKDCSCLWDVSVLELRDGGKYIFDSRFNDAIADEYLVQMGRRKFAAQYLNNPTDPGSVWFPYDKVQAAEIDPSEISKLRQQLVWYMAVDPAESTEKRSCYTAVVCVGVDHTTGIWYVDYARQERVDPPGFIELIFSARRACKPNYFGMELNTRKANEYILRDKMAVNGDFFHITPLRPSILPTTPKNKEARITRLVPLFEFGRIRVNNRLHDLLNALYTLPAATTWDLADALSYVIDMVPTGLGAHVATSKELPLKVDHGYITRAPRGNGGIRRITRPAYLSALLSKTSRAV